MRKSGSAISSYSRWHLLLKEILKGHILQKALDDREYLASIKRWIIDKNFGNWENRFCINVNKVYICSEKVVLIALASIVIHNMCEKLRETYTPGCFVNHRDENKDGELLLILLTNPPAHSP